MPQLKQEFSRLVSSGNPPEPAASLEGLPLIEVAADSPRGSMAIVYSGDGGWASIDKGLAAQFAKEGIPVVGVDSLRYFWRRRTPESCARDLEKILAHYSDKWGVQDILLVGYSFGADVLAPIINRMDASWRNRVRLAAFLAPGAKADFEFHLTDWIGSLPGPASIPVIPELERLNVPGLCVYGLDERDDVCTAARSKTLRPLGLKGGHHLGGDVDAISNAILKVVQTSHR